MPDEYLENVGKAAADQSRQNPSACIGTEPERFSIPVAAKGVCEMPSLKCRRPEVSSLQSDQLLKIAKSAANRQAVESGVVESKTRYDSNDDRVRKQHGLWSGETVPINERYSSGELYPGESEWLCRCSERFNLRKDLLENSA